MAKRERRLSQLHLPWHLYPAPVGSKHYLIPVCECYQLDKIFQGCWLGLQITSVNEFKEHFEALLVRIVDMDGSKIQDKIFRQFAPNFDGFIPVQNPSSYLSIDSFIPLVKARLNQSHRAARTTQWARKQQPSSQSAVNCSVSKGSLPSCTRNFMSAYCPVSSTAPIHLDKFVLAVESIARRSFDWKIANILVA